MKNVFSKERLLIIAEEIGAWFFSAGIILSVTWITTIIF
jgi:hypothetical protein